MNIRTMKIWTMKIINFYEEEKVELPKLMEQYCNMMDYKGGFSPYRENHLNGLLFKGQALVWLDVFNKL